MFCMFLLLNSLNIQSEILPHLKQQMKTEELGHISYCFDSLAITDRTFLVLQKLTLILYGKKLNIVGSNGQIVNN